MRKVSAKQIKEKVKELFLEANFHIGEDVLNSIKEASAVLVSSKMGNSDKGFKGWR